LNPFGRARKSLRDSTSGASFVVVRLGERGDTTRLFRKPDVKTLRNMAEHSVWVRAAIDYYRATVGGAAAQIVPFDESRPVNDRVKRDIEKLLRRPNQTGDSYSTIKKQMIEDFLVVGHGAVEKEIRRDGAPRAMSVIDAATLAFVEGWTGKDPRMPRYALLRSDGTLQRTLADLHVMAMVNRPRSYDKLGLSHVETLYKAVMALLEADDYLLRQITDAAPSGALDLGEGTTQEQADQMRQSIQAVRKAFVVIGGTKGAKFLRFNATEREMRLLDQQVWFVRQVAAIFGMSTAKLRLAVDLSRANAGEMLDDDQEGPNALLWDIRETEQAKIVECFGPVEEHNCQIHYAILNKRDERKQAEVTKIQIGGGSWVSINEARRDAGKPLIEGLKVADEVLVPNTKGVPIPLSLLEEMHFGGGDGSGEGDEGDGGKGKAGEGEHDEEEEGESLDEAA
jgi:hypothetical protein